MLILSSLVNLAYLDIVQPSLPCFSLILPGLPWFLSDDIVQVDEPSPSSPPPPLLSPPGAQHKKLDSDNFIYVHALLNKNI